MRFGAKRTVTHTEPTNFGLLRVRVEQHVPVSSIIAVTSATPDDGKEIAARGLAYSLSMCGYSTLFIDTALASRRITTPPQGLGIGVIDDSQSPSDSGDGRLAVMTLDDITLAQTTSFRGMLAALGILRRAFDYVVISTDLGMATAFGAVLAADADSVLVTFKSGRRKKDDDVRLAAELGRIGSRALGIVALSPEVIASNTATWAPAARASRRRMTLAWAAHLTHALFPQLVNQAATKRSAGDRMRLALMPGSGQPPSVGQFSGEGRGAQVPRPEVVAAALGT